MPKAKEEDKMKTEPVPRAKMGSPRKKWVHVLVSEEEHIAWHDKATSAGLPLSSLIRQKMDTGIIGRKRKMVEHDPDLVREIAKIGNNINQIARAINTEKSSDGIDLLVLLSAIERDLREVIDAH